MPNLQGECRLLHLFRIYIYIVTICSLACVGNVLSCEWLQRIKEDEKKIENTLHLENCLGTIRRRCEFFSYSTPIYTYERGNIV